MNDRDESPDDREGLTHKSRGVVVPHSLRIPERFQQRIGLNDLIL